MNSQCSLGQCILQQLGGDIAGSRPVIGASMVAKSRIGQHPARYSPHVVVYEFFKQYIIVMRCRNDIFKTFSVVDGALPEMELIWVSVVMISAGQHTRGGVLAIEAL